MTTLRTFQNEIDEIHNREISKQRAQAMVEKEKEKHSKGKVKEDTTHIVPAPASAAEHHGAGSEGDLQELVDRILVRHDHPLQFHLFTHRRLSLIDALDLSEPCRPRPGSGPGCSSPHAEQRRVCVADRGAASACRALFWRSD